MPRTARPVAERLRDRATIDPETECWIFDGLDSHGYGQIWVGSRTNGTRRLRKAHIVSYETFVGSTPPGLELDHLCRNRACCNPDHLEPVSHRVNVQRGAQGDEQAARTHCPQDHPYSAENTYRDRHGKRYCIACRKSRDRLGRTIPSEAYNERETA